MSATILPQGWKELSLEDFAILNMGQSPKGEYVNENGEGVPFYQGKTEFGKIHPSPRKNCTAPTKLANEGDILLSVRAPVGPTNICQETSCIGRGLAGIRSHIRASQPFLHHFFRNIEPWLSQQGTGSTFKAVSGGFLRGILVPVPPLNEQTRIANKLDELLSQVDTIKARIDAIPAILKRFRQSVLAAAVSGKLTEELRKENNVAGWEITNLEKLVIASANGLSKRIGKSGEEVTILRLADFRNAVRINGNERTIRLDNKEKEKYGLKSGDLLVIRVNGSVDIAGKFIEYSENGELEGFCDHFIRLRLDIQKVLPSYVVFVANEGTGRNYLKNNLSTSAGQNTINQGSVKGLEIPLPSLEEQKQIVQKAEQLFAFADQIEQRVKDAQSRINNLTQSILAKAFRGELVPQDPNDEPASVLLERIKQEREAAAKLLKAAKKVVKKKVKA